MALKTMQFKRERGGQNWLTIQTGWFPGSPWVLTVSAYPPLAIAGGAKQLHEHPTEWQSPDGSGLIRIEVPDLDCWRTPAITLNGVDLPGSAGSPEGKMDFAVGMAILFVALSFGLGLINTFSLDQYGLFSPLSWNIVTVTSLIGVILMWKKRPMGSAVFLTAVVVDTFVGLLWVLSLEFEPVRGADLVASQLDIGDPEAFEQTATAAWVWGIVALDMAERVWLFVLCLQWKRLGKDLGLFGGAAPPRG